MQLQSGIYDGESRFMRVGNLVVEASKGMQKVSAKLLRVYKHCLVTIRHLLTL